MGERGVKVVGLPRDVELVVRAVGDGLLVYINGAVETLFAKVALDGRESEFVLFFGRLSFVGGGGGVWFWLTKGQMGSDTILMLKVVMVDSCRWNSRLAG